jgi:hypothetical protein
MTPPPIIQQLPVTQRPAQQIKKTSLLLILAFFVGACLLFVLDTFMSLIVAGQHHPHMMLITYFFGYFEGAVLIPLIVIVGICAIFPSNRRPYRLLQCTFWTLLGMVILQTPQFISAVSAFRQMGQNS